VFLVCLAKGFKCFEKLKLIISLKEEIEIDKREKNQEMGLGGPCETHWGLTPKL
jgi:hypothetical protein